MIFSLKQIQEKCIELRKASNAGTDARNVIHVPAEFVDSLSYQFSSSTLSIKYIFH